MTTPTSPSVTEFYQQLRAWESAVAQWLGLNLDEVWDLTTKPDGWGRLTGVTQVTWKSTAMVHPVVGHFEHWDIDAGENGPVFTGHLVLDPADAERMESTVGPKPELMSAAEEAALRARLAVPHRCPNCGHVQD